MLHFPLLPLVITALPVAHQLLLFHERSKLRPPGQLIPVNGHLLHVYRAGPNRAPTLVFLSGGGTPAPLYDFRPLLRLLTKDFSVAVLEKPGYGYAPPAHVPRDVDTLIAESRHALRKAGCMPPYVLLPHSYSGLEALAWAVRYPEEVKAIVGLDMAIPSVYDHLRFSSLSLALCTTVHWIGLQRLLPQPYLPSLTPAERGQTRKLWARNLYAAPVRLELQEARTSAQRVAALGSPQCPILLFLSDGKQIGSFWLPEQRRFARQTGAKTVFLPCGHYVHRHFPSQIAATLRTFLSE